jgi:hypothetical protein
LGGDLTYQYGKNGNLSNVSLTPAQGILGSTQFGTAAQTLQPAANLQDTSPQLGERKAINEAAIDPKSEELRIDGRFGGSCLDVVMSAIGKIET